MSYIEFKYQFEGVRRVANPLRGPASRGKEKTISPFIVGAAQELVEILRAEPYPEPPSPTYTRTGLLGKSWAAGRATGSSAYITNSAEDRRGRPYAVLVVGSPAEDAGVNAGPYRRQAWMHAKPGRWWLAKVIIETKGRPVLDRLKKNITDALADEIADEIV